MDANFRTQSTDGYGDRDDIALERDRQWNSRPPEGYTRWEDYEAAQEAQRHPFKQLEDCRERFTATLTNLITQNLEAGQATLAIWADQFPGSDIVDEIVEAIGITEGIEIDWENIAAPGSDKVDLIFAWEVA